MKFAELENLWSNDLSRLSNSDKGRVFYERAKQVVAEALADPKKRAQAVSGNRFARTYLVNKIGCQPAVAQQNPKIKRLLAITDTALGHEVLTATSNRAVDERQSAGAPDLESMNTSLRLHVETAQQKNDELLRRLSRYESNQK